LQPALPKFGTLYQGKILFSGSLSSAVEASLRGAKHQPSSGQARPTLIDGQFWIFQGSALTQSCIIQFGNDQTLVADCILGMTVTKKMIMGFYSLDY